MALMTRPAATSSTPRPAAATAAAAATVVISVDPAKISLRAAQAQARAAVKQGKRAVLQLASGRHDLSACGSLTLTAADTHTSWVGPPQGAAAAVVSGGARLPPSSFSLVSIEDPVRERLPPAVADAVLRVDVSAHRAAFTYPGPRGRNAAGFRRADGSIDPVACAPMMDLLGPAGESLFTTARWPNPDDELGDDVVHGWALTGRGSNETGFRYPSSAPPLALPATHLFAAGYWMYDWADATILISDLDSRASFARVAQLPLYVNESQTRSFVAGSRFFFLNQPEYLDQIGEWWLDHATGLLYVLPPAGWNGAVLSIADSLFKLEAGAHAITFKDLTLIAARDTAVKCGTLTHPPKYDCSADEITFSGCTLRGFGSSAIAVHGGASWTLTNTTVSGTGGTAVYLSGGNRSQLLPARHMLSNSTVREFSRTCWSYQPGLALTGVGSTVRNNEISHGPHQAVLWSGNDHMILRNVIHDVVLQTFDSAAIYASDRDWSMRGTVMRQNYIYRVGNASTVCNTHTSCARHAIYLDSLTDGFIVDGNIVEQSAALAKHNTNGQGILNNGGRDNILTNNLCLGWAACVLSGDAGCVHTMIV